MRICPAHLRIRAIERQQHLNLQERADVIDLQQLDMGIAVVPFPAGLVLEEEVLMAERMEEGNRPAVIGRERPELVFLVILATIRG